MKKFENCWPGPVGAQKYLLNKGMNESVGVTKFCHFQFPLYVFKVVKTLYFAFFI